MSMNVETTKKGDYVVYANPNAGTKRDMRLSQVLLEVGEKYKIRGIHVQDFKTDVYLDGFSARFNSVMFDNVDNGITEAIRYRRRAKDAEVELEKVEKQRDELLAACKGAVTALCNNCSAGPIERG